MIFVYVRPLLAAVLSAVAVVALSTVPAQASSAAAPGAPGETVTTTLYAAVDALPVADESRAGYERSKFRHWIDADANGCNTRKETILTEAVVAPEVGPRCSLTGGVWFSLYDQVTAEDAAGLDVDHMVPLAEAWDSGASAWTAAERQGYANDLDDPRSLIAVTARSNRQKSDKDPADWLPVKGYICTYITDWATVKTRWGLAADSREKEVLTRLASSCANEPITVELAR
ncbi:HNH endonuclease family protein [Streptomyces sp. NPDC048484]|uniref:HNH endonuclease family protein n=1 Tax=Streptomyces sp. NPDC048484 TaxID=3155146 RepID=UPI00343BD0CF